MRRRSVRLSRAAALWRFAAFPRAEAAAYASAPPRRARVRRHLDGRRSIRECAAEASASAPPSGRSLHERLPCFPRAEAVGVSVVTLISVLWSVPAAMFCILAKHSSPSSQLSGPSISLLLAAASSLVITEKVICGGLRVRRNFLRLFGNFGNFGRLAPLLWLVCWRSGVRSSLGPSPVAVCAAPSPSGVAGVSRWPSASRSSFRNAWGEHYPHGLLRLSWSFPW